MRCFSDIASASFEINPNKKTYLSIYLFIIEAIYKQMGLFETGIRVTTIVFWLNLFYANGSVIFRYLFQRFGAGTYIRK